MRWIDLPGAGWWPWLELIGLALGVVLAAVLVHRVGAVILERLTRGTTVPAEMVHAARRPAYFVLPLIGLQLLWHASAQALPSVLGLRHVNALLLIAALTWLGLRLVRAAGRGMLKLHPVTGADNLGARRIQTQVRVLSRTLMFVILLVGLGLMLMTFPGVRQVGASLLASAGVAGLIAGLAARPVISNLISGLQLALAQPLRLDDVLVVEGEWGHVEEITGTYVVLRIWDQRRLIIPLQWFIENPFQNWTRNNADIVGSVFLWIDYRMPIEPLRAEALRICQGSPDWDGRTCVLHVTEAGEHSVQCRVLVSSPDAGRNWELRCTVREKLVDFVQREYPQHLPQLRADVQRCLVPA